MSTTPLWCTSRPSRGFTLIEVLAVILLTSMVLGVALNTYVDLSVQSNQAVRLTRNARHATAILDRVAGDMEAAVLAVKPEERDPLEHPWLFLGENRGNETGADRLKWVTRGRALHTSQARASDLSLVAYLTESLEDGSLALWRWSSPQLPEGLDRTFPGVDSPGSFLLADGMASFGVRFMSEDGEWVDEWDSSTLVRSSQLPLVAEIELWMMYDEESELAEGPFTRRVLLPLRPLDLQAQLNPEAGEGSGDGDEDGEEGEEDCKRVRDCVDVSKLTPDLMNVVFDLMDQCVADTGLPNEVLAEECL